MNVVLRIVRRLPTVLSAECYPYESTRLRAVAFVHVDPAAAGDGNDVPTLAAEQSVALAPVVCGEARETWMLMAHPDGLERCIERLRESGSLLDLTVTVLPIE